MMQQASIQSRACLRAAHASGAAHDSTVASRILRARGLRWLAFGVLLAAADGRAAPLVPAFSSQQAGTQVPQGWEPLSFRKGRTPTSYALVNDEGTLVLKANAQSSASALVHRLHVDPKEFPTLRWRWRIAHVLSGSDIARKNGDDYPARVYVTFDLDPKRASLGERMRHKVAQAAFGKDLPYASLCYVWDNKSAVGTIVPNAYTANVRMIVVRSGAARAGQWIAEERNLLEDYRAAFGSDPPPLSGVAIMTDTDDTGESATAWYGDISLEPAAAGALKVSR